jgi:hypothetical protein
MTKQTLLIHVFKGSKIKIDRQREKESWYFAGILLLENMIGRIGGKLADLEKLRLIWAGASITSSVSC